MVQNHNGIFKGAAAEVWMGPLFLQAVKLVMWIASPQVQIPPIEHPVKVRPLKSSPFLGITVCLYCFFLKLGGGPNEWRCSIWFASQPRGT